jgi:hypothetical protein
MPVQKIGGEGSPSPVTVADLPIEAHQAYATGVQGLEVGQARDSLAVSTRTSIPTTTPSYQSLEAQLMEEHSRVILADLPPLKGLPPDTLFARQALPGQDPKLLKLKIAKFRGSEAEKKFGEDFVSDLSSIQDDMDSVNGLRGQFHKG